MSSTPATFATLRALHALVGDALDDIQRVFSQSQLINTPSPPSSLCSSPAYPGTPEPASSFPTTPSASFPPTPLSSTFPYETGPPSLSHIIDYPSPDKPFVPTSLAEQLAAHPHAAAAAMRIVAACGQISNIVHKPFLSLCDGLMAYNLPACLRLIEYLHVVEILRETEDDRQSLLARSKKKLQRVPGQISLSDDEPPFPPSEPEDGQPSVYEVGKSGILSSLAQGNESACSMKQERDGREGTAAAQEGMHVTDLARVICTHTKKDLIDPSKLAHALRLLSAHHLLRETAPDTFALTRVASLLDSGKSVKEVFSSPETKYEDTNGIAAFVGMTADELFKSAAYLTEALTGVQLPNRPAVPRNPIDKGTSECSVASTAYEDCVDSFLAHVPTNRSPSVLTQTVETNEDEEIGIIPGFSHPAQPLENVAVLYPPGYGVRNTNRDTVSPPSSLRPHTNEGISSLFQLRNDRQTNTLDASKEQDDVPAFNLAFHTPVSFFEWLENGGRDPLGGTGVGAGHKSSGLSSRDTVERMPGLSGYDSSKSFRLERFSKAMVGTSGWEAPGAILSGFDWQSLPNGSTIIDVGGGIGSTTMVLARAFDGSGTVGKRDNAENERIRLPQTTTTTRSGTHRTQLSDSSFSNSDESCDNRAPKDALNVRFIIQDRPVVIDLGLAAWRSQCPDMLESGRVEFQDHDFFQPQPPLSPLHLNPHPAVYLLRVVLHDWPDDFARRILVNLRRASGPETKLLIADHVLPLACIDESVERYHRRGNKTCQENERNEWTLDSVLARLEGAERALAMPPLLPNLGKATANAYWMDLLMHITFNGKERTLRELCALALSAGWRIARMTRSEGSMFAYLVCVPIPLPEDAQDDGNTTEAVASTDSVPSDAAAAPTPKSTVKMAHQPPAIMPLLPSPVLERSSSRCGTPTFGSRMSLPRDDEINTKGKATGTARKWLKARSLGVRTVVAHKVEKLKLKDEDGQKGSTKASPFKETLNDHDHASPQHTRVWWKKPLGGSTLSVTESDQPVPEHQAPSRPRRGTITQHDAPTTPAQNLRAATPSSNKRPTHHAWPSTELVASPDSGGMAERSRRPSVASITRKLSFATFSRRPSIPDLDEPLPSPPPSATYSDLAPPPSLHVNQQQDTGRKLKHLQSSPVLRRGDSDATPTINRISSLADVVGSSRPDAGSPISGILIRGSATTSPSSSQHHFPIYGVAGSSQSASPPTPHRQRSVTLVAGSSGSARVGPSGIPLEPIPASPKVKRTPKMPRRLSIPLLRRKQSNAVLPDQVGDEGNLEERP